MDMFVAIADSTRRTILELLASRGELAATTIYEHFPVSPQAVSQHLKVLREAQLVEMEKRARQHLYRLNPQTLSHFEAWVQHMQQMWSERFDALAAVLEIEKQRRTRLTVQSVFQPVPDRDGALQSGMQEGVNDTHDRLAEILKKM